LVEHVTRNDKVRSSILRGGSTSCVSDHFHNKKLRDTICPAIGELTFTSQKEAILAQLVERVHGKDEVPSSILGDGSRIKLNCFFGTEIKQKRRSIDRRFETSCVDKFDTIATDIAQNVRVVGLISCIACETIANIPNVDWAIVVMHSKTHISLFEKLL
jgi:hypothetical protein